ncbi:MAG: hypothetical protein WA269_15400 [Candidatus Udaeobacter sp.]
MRKSKNEKVGRKWLLTPTGTLVITDKSESKLPGIMTLHDLVRARVAVAEREGTSG